MAGRERGRGGQDERLGSFPAGWGWREAAGGGAARGLNRRRFLGGMAAAAGAGLLVACGGDGKSATQNTTPGSSSPAAGAQSGPVPKGGTLIGTQVASDAKGFHPYVTTDSPSAAFQGYIYGVSLTDRDPKTLDIIGAGAEKWTISDDKLTYTFNLRDMKWSDGQPFTAYDYEWTYQQAKKPENNYPYATNLDPIEEYRAIDAKTLRIRQNEPLVVGLENADVITPLPKHIWEKLPWDDPVKNPEMSAPTVGNGLWKLKEWKRENFATFVANDLYWEGRPNIDTYTLRFFGTLPLAYQALKAGDVDWSGFQPSDYKEAKTLSNITVYEYYLARGAWSYIGFNFRRPALKDVNVRRAVAYATDRKSIIDRLAFGLGRPTYSIFPPSSWVHNPNVEKYDFSVQKAADSFRSAGYTLGSDKKLRKDGQQLTLKVLYNTGNPVREGIATVMKQQLEELGAAVDVQGLEFQAYLDALKKEPYDYDLFVLGWNSTLEPHFAKQIWDERSIPSLNSGAYVNKEVERLFEQGGREFDREKRKGIYGQIQKILADDLPYVFLYENRGYSGVNKKVGGIEPTELGIAYNMDKWYITK